MEQNNVKGDRRFFIPLVSESEWDADGATITIPFEYRPLSGREAADYGRSSQQEAILGAAVSAIPERLKDNAQALAALTGERRGDENDPVSHLEHHLRRYVRRNNADFFIHKDLAGFLNRELDFYLKNEVLNLDNLAVAGQDMSEGWFQQMRLTKAVGSKIIDFLAQIEDFQKMLWEKRKFVTETQYCIIMSNIAPEFYPEILANEAQWDEWRELFDIDGADRSAAFLQAHPALVLDTKHFDEEFTDRLVASFDDLDGMTDGLLIHGENLQALTLLKHQLQSSVKVAYYDPPYNTSEETFVYKNDYRHSSWLSMMADRISPLMGMLSGDGVVLLAIDDEEVYRLKLAMDHLLGEEKYLGTVVVQSNPRGRSINSYYATSHDYYLIYAADAEQARIVDQPLTGEQSNEYRHSDEQSNYRLLPFRRSGGLSTPDERPNSEFTLYYSQHMGRIVGVGGDRKQPYPARYEPAGILYATGTAFQVCEVDPLDFWRTAPKDTVAILPVDTHGSRRVWRWSNRRKILEAAYSEEFVIQTSKGRDSVLLKDRVKSGRKPKTIWSESKYDASSHGTSLLQDILGGRGLFGYPKSLHSTLDSVHSVAGNDTSALVVDVFAGSGTTGHAVINLNREDGGERKFVLVEMGEYFDTVLLPRIKKVTYTPVWKEGKPQCQATAEKAERSPRIVKYLRLESYDDALDSIEFDQSSGQLRLPDATEEYLLKYMLSWETKDSATLLNPVKLTSPFSYRLRVHAKGEKRERTVDLPETFNYLLGLKVQKREVYDDGRRYLVFRGETQAAPGRKVAVIWRETEGWTEDDFARDRDFVARHNLTGDADTVYVNGDSAIPGAKPIEPMFKSRMFAAVNV